MKAKITPKNIWAYIQGNIRYKLFYSKYDFFYNLIPDHIKDQITSRILSMDKSCYSRGRCTMCGCQTTHLQMADKACDKPCYPAMLNKKKWERILKGKIIYCKETDTHWRLGECKEFIKVY